jgi:hypothetical protein
LVSLVSHVLFHWTAPGYLLLMPLLGAALERRRQAGWPVGRWLSTSAILVLLGVGLFAGEVRFNWLPQAVWMRTLGKDPLAATVDWTSLRDALGARGLLGRPGLVVAAIRWLDAGKIDYALAGRVPVLCLGPDPRQYGLAAPLSLYAGDDVLIIAPGRSPAEVEAGFGALFDRIRPMAPAAIRAAGKPVANVPLFIGYQLHPPAASRGGIAGSP